MILWENSNDSLTVIWNKILFLLHLFLKIYPFMWLHVSTGWVFNFVNVATILQQKHLSTSPICWPRISIDFFRSVTSPTFTLHILWAQGNHHSFCAYRRKLYNLSYVVVCGSSSFWDILLDDHVFFYEDRQEFKFLLDYHVFFYEDRQAIWPRLDEPKKHTVCWLLNTGFGLKSIPKFNNQFCIFVWKIIFYGCSLIPHPQPLIRNGDVASGFWVTMRKIWMTNLVVVKTISVQNSDIRIFLIYFCPCF